MFRWFPWFLGGIVVLFVLMLIIGKARDRSISQSAAPNCNAEKADGLVQQMMKEDFFYKIEVTGGFPRIYVKDNWYLVTIDGKKTFDDVLQCHFTRGTENPMLGVYRDHRSGKEVATTGGVSGFAMK